MDVVARALLEQLALVAAVQGSNYRVPRFGKRTDSSKVTLSAMKGTTKFIAHIAHMPRSIWPSKTLRPH
jgi:hypothetical protein